MTRQELIDRLRYTGYHNDEKSFTRYYCEHGTHKITYPNARKAFREGQILKEKGVPCTCDKCRENPQSL